MKLKYQHTMYACFIAYIVQAIVNNFVPLLFLTFHTTYGIPMSKITFLVTFNFGLQLVIDFLSAWFVDRIGYRVCVVLSHLLSAFGFLALIFLPQICSDPFIGLLISVMVYAVGGGLIEVLISPIVEACPSENKEAAMSLLHSFYCWGHVGVVLISTIFFFVFGIEQWRILAGIWAIVPLCNAIFFLRVPIARLIEEGEQGLSFRELFANKIFWVMVLLMICAGASELAVSQWASTYAEISLGMKKSIGDLFGPMLFAVTMGITRVLYAKYGEKLNLQKTILGSSVLCLFSYFLLMIAKGPVVGILGLELCGCSVGILWPGVFSISSANIRRGGTAMFALLALAGDFGCSLGPTVVGRVSGMMQDDLRIGILTAGIFPVILICGILYQIKKTEHSV